jgi:hypothetical protein
MGFLDDLLKAVKDVENSYLNVSNYSTNDRTITDLEWMIEKDLKIYNSKFVRNMLDVRYKSNVNCRERNFCYELYTNWRIIMKKNIEKEKEKSPYLNLTLNGEINKANLTQFLIKNRDSLNNLIYDPQMDFILKTSKLEIQKNFEPDLTLHGGNGNFDDQRLIVEVKTELTKSETEIIKDYYKLLIYKKAFFFKMAVFVAVKFDPDFLKDLFIKQIPEEILKSNEVFLILRYDQKVILTTFKKFINNEPVLIEEDI